jgi:hypothetical protein
MHVAVVIRALAVALLTAHAASAAPLLPVSIHVDADRYEVAGEGNSVIGVRRAPVSPCASPAEIASALRREEPVAAVVRITRATPPQVIDYAFCVTTDGILVVGRQVRTLDPSSGRYVFTEGDIKRAYPALEAISPWMWIVEIPLGREVGLTLELRAMTPAAPIRAVFVTPRLVR